MRKKLNIAKLGSSYREFKDGSFMILSEFRVGPKRKVIKHGHAFRLLSSGELYEEGEFFNGFRTGEWKAFGQRGGVISLGTYQEGKRIGHWRHWESDGTLVSEGLRKNDKAVGIWYHYYAKSRRILIGEYKDDFTWEGEFIVGFQYSRCKKGKTVEHHREVPPDCGYSSQNVLPWTREIGLKVTRPLM